MIANLTATQRTLAIMHLLGGKATVAQIAADPRWHGRWPDDEQIRRTLVQMADVGLVTRESDEGDGQLSLFRIDPSAEGNGVRYSFLLTGAAPMFNGEVDL